MINSYTAYTYEIDDHETAVKDIKSQLNMEKNMKKNTVGILACDHEFVTAGAVKEICRNLPFEVIGGVSTAQGINGTGTEGAMIFTLMMFTSDSVEFKICLTETLKGDYQKSITDAYNNINGGISENPAFIISVAPYMRENSGEFYVDALTKASGGAPCFGTMAIDDSNDIENSCSICNGEAYKDRMAMILFYGDVNPKFYTASISNDKILNQAALITSSENHVLKEVNGRPVAEFFEKLNLTKASRTDYAMMALPFIVDYNDGTPPVSKAFVSLDEKENAICAGIMPEGATLYIGVIDKDDVLLTTSQIVREALEENRDAKNMLIYSCVTRGMSLDGDICAEIRKVKDTVSDKIQFMMVYSGGEMCPATVDRSGNKLINRFHNNTFVLCIF
ncbi:MAG: FIST C-terminal domain-containing protein [Oscillospiraceae bacterium]|nr:FIST C-terminal domain-containing protein [Oscillospiraceae bacterium]